MKQLLSVICIVSFMFLVTCKKQESVAPTPQAATQSAEPTAEKPESGPFLIANREVFGIRPGMLLQDVEKAVGKENVRLKKVTYEPEGVPEEATEVEILVEGKVAIKSTLKDNKSLTAISVIDSRFHTPEGISISSTIGEIKKAYPDLKIEFLEGYYVESEKAGLCFELKDMGSQPTDNSIITAIIIVMNQSSGTPTSEAMADRLTYDVECKLSGVLISSTANASDTYDEKPHTFPAIELAKPVSVQCAPDDQENSPENNVRIMQLVLNGPLTQAFVKAKGRKVVLTGKLFHSMTGHHFTPVLVDVISISPE